MLCTPIAACASEWLCSLQPDRRWVRRVGPGWLRLEDHQHRCVSLPPTQVPALCCPRYIAKSLFGICTVYVLHPAVMSMWTHLDLRNCMSYGRPWGFPTRYKSVMMGTQFCSPCWSLLAPDVRSVHCIWCMKYLLLIRNRSQHYLISRFSSLCLIWSWTPQTLLVHCTLCLFTILCAVPSCTKGPPPKLVKGSMHLISDISSPYLVHCHAVQKDSLQTACIWSQRLVQYIWCL